MLSVADNALAGCKRELICLVAAWYHIQYVTPCFLQACKCSNDETISQHFNCRLANYLYSHFLIPLPGAFGDRTDRKFSTHIYTLGVFDKCNIYGCRLSEHKVINMIFFQRNINVVLWKLEWFTINCFYNVKAEGHVTTTRQHEATLHSQCNHNQTAGSYPILHSQCHHNQITGSDLPYMLHIRANRI